MKYIGFIHQVITLTKVQALFGFDQFFPERFNLVEMKKVIDEYIAITFVFMSM